MAKRKTAWFVYMLECRGGKIYTGITTDVAARFKKHCTGKGAAYTRANKPLHVLAVKRSANRSMASRLEARLKQLERPDKLRWAQKSPFLRPPA